MNPHAEVPIEKPEVAAYTIPTDLPESDGTLEWDSHDRARIEHMLFDGAATPVDRELTPDWTRPGLGLELKWADAQRYAA